MNVIRQTACLLVNPITVNNFAVLFNCTPAGRASDLRLRPKNCGWGSMLCLWLDFSCSSVSMLVLLLSTHLVSPQCDLYVYCFDALMN